MTPELPAGELLRKLEARGSVRKFRSDPVPPAWLDALLAAGQRAPSSSNVQACSIIVVHDVAARGRLAELAGGQQHIVDCPVYLVFCADLSRLQRACEARGMAADDTLEVALVASIDAALAGMTVSIAAESMGLSSVFIGAMRNHPLEVASLLGLPPRAYAVFGMCIGWAASPPVPKPRMPLAAFVHHDRYDATRQDEALRSYDATLATYYRAQGRQTADDAWAGVIAKTFSARRRSKLRAELLALGFRLE